MACRSHNYVYTQGYFVCTKCKARHYGKSRKSRNIKKITTGITISAIIGIVGVLFVTGTIEFDQKIIDDSIKNIPQNIEDASKTAQDIATETRTTITQKVNEQIENVPPDPVATTVETIKNIPKKIQETPLSNKPLIDKLSLEKQVHQLTNQYRTQNGLAELDWDEKLAVIARNHSIDMAARNYFDHENPQGQDPTDRANSQRYSCHKTIGNLIYDGIAENIFQNNLYDTVWRTNGVISSYEWNSQDELAQTTVSGWMDSPGHRQNILTKTYDREGIGIAISSDDKVYITQDFC
ncbi:CAP domain-containing protein [Candidatus Nitrosarchaeum limnium]|jgi:uncharacterized protein YkwD|uniref:SCP-like protein n=1 Tax=Candidatus Nitrosarchaeum limnium BG20 TaxID=859192 RepID=S2E9P9_9ARCH|nr:CAP domain-containing protein [Candidatus Nitrosarchaeum limnium]EPA06096.1 SCP-like protein [Candidatus Nitrosarchaeum limnium BG20]